ncbi:hypothetical protein EV421DRAFT_1730231 [Armillaria borealis]|uniref:Uncharacterized protein n=1 Tax=Armillaria borealis TaxID=47425 RepID=A0AA39N0P7_9AGAR|nr:hypothetical protein EV421DRAFT_1730231 [Armillaria borealis]
MLLNYLLIRNMILQKAPTPGQQLDRLVQPSIESIGIILSSPPEIHVGNDGYECIKGPLNQNQRRIWQGIAHGTILKRCPPGNNYIVPKRAPQPGVPFEEAPDSIVCLSPQGPLAQEFSDFTLPNYATKYKAQADPADIALNLPGVSIARLLTQEQNVLVNANSFIENSLLGTDVQIIKVNLFVQGCENHGMGISIPLECNHGFLTHLGLAHMISDGFYRILHTQESPTDRPSAFEETDMRLVALFSTDVKGSLWNAALGEISTQSDENRLLSRLVMATCAEQEVLSTNEGFTTAYVKATGTCFRPMSVGLERGTSRSHWDWQGRTRRSALTTVGETSKQSRYGLLPPTWHF